jgi:mRNA interferase HigB
MQVIARRTLKQFWERHPQAAGPLRAWFAVASKARWRGPADVKRQFGATVDFVADNRIIFDIGGNRYRLIVRVSYEFGRLMIKFVGTHKEYDKIDPVHETLRRKRD